MLTLSQSPSQIRRGTNEAPREVHVVRSVLLLGEFLMKYDAYHNSLKHAILQPQPPSATVHRPSQGYLTHKKLSPPKDCHRALGIARLDFDVQKYLTYKKTHPPRTLP